MEWMTTGLFSLWTIEIYSLWEGGLKRGSNGLHLQMEYKRNNIGVGEKQFAISPILPSVVRIFMKTIRICELRTAISIPDINACDIWKRELFMKHKNDRTAWKIRTISISVLSKPLLTYSNVSCPSSIYLRITQATYFYRLEGTHVKGCQEISKHVSENLLLYHVMRTLEICFLWNVIEYHLENKWIPENIIQLAIK